MSANAAVATLRALALFIRSFFASSQARPELLIEHDPQAERKPDYFSGIFTPDDESKKKTDKDEDKRIQVILNRLRRNGIDTMVEANVEYALQKSNGDSEEAFKLLLLLQNAYEGIVEPYNPSTKLLGAVNRQAVTCYADSLLFAMFARLDSFEAMLYDSFDDLARKKLAGLLRLWVNMLRTGRLITTDVTAHLQSALADCGWAEAASLKQQDPSEAFTFITGQLKLPLLTLKMDLYHTGKEDPTDDHKFINERLLEVAIPDAPEEGSDAITLEQCLEQYFNNRIEVKRHLEKRRRDTLKSVNSERSVSKVEKESGLHVEVLEISDSTPITPIGNGPMVETPIQTKNPVEMLRPTAGRKRADSIFSQRKVALTGIDPEQLKASDAPQDEHGRKMSTRTEVLMPAWQFFKLLPWYTDHLPTSDAQVAAHFSRKRPVLGICLKRYFYTNEGRAQRRSDYVDIPLEIGLPNFLSEDNGESAGSLVANFKLVLQSVVCHRGVSVNSGHYVALCRGAAANPHHRDDSATRPGSADSDEAEDPWMRFDDLARERVSYVDIQEGLRKETPYLLFYQVLPVDEDGRSIHEPPSYAEATSRTQSNAKQPGKLLIPESMGSEVALARSNSTAQSDISTTSAIDSEVVTTEATNFAPGGDSTRPSLDIKRALELHKSRSSIDKDRRTSVEGSIRGGGMSSASEKTTSIPTTPSEEKGNGFLSVTSKMGGSRRSSRATRSSGTISRSGSAGAEGGGNRMSLSFTKLTQRRSKNEMPAVAIEPLEAVAAELDAGEEHLHDSSIRGASVFSSESEAGNATKPPPQPRGSDSKRDKRLRKIHRNKAQEDRDCVVM